MYLNQRLLLVHFLWGSYNLHIDDINNDGFDDAVLHLDKAGVCGATSNEVDYPLKASADATLTGSNADGDFEGIGDIRIVKR